MILLSCEPYNLKEVLKQFLLEGFNTFLHMKTELYVAEFLGSLLISPLKIYMQIIGYIIV